MSRPEPSISPAWGWALHEAGHLICAEAFGWRPVELSCSRKQGRAVFSMQKPLFRVWIISQSHAGPIAQKRSWCGARWTNHPTRTYRPPLRPRVIRHPKRPRPNPVESFCEGSDGEIIDRHAEQSLPPAPSAGVDARRVSSLGWWLACRVLAYREAALHALADEAYRLGVLGADEIQGVLRRHPEGLEQAARVALAAVRLHARWVRCCEQAGEQDNQKGT